MPVVRNIQKVGNSKGVILTNELKHLGLDEAVQITLEADCIVISAPPVTDAGVTPPLRPGRNRQSREEALRSTLSQYRTTLQRLAEAPNPKSDGEEG